MTYLNIKYLLHVDGVSQEKQVIESAEKGEQTGEKTNGSCLVSRSLDLYSPMLESILSDEPIQEGNTTVSTEGELAKIGVISCDHIDYLL